MAQHVVPGGRPGIGPVWTKALAVAAAAAVAIAVMQAVFVSQAAGQKRVPASQASLKFAVADVTGTSPPQIREVATGAVVARVKLPTEPGSQAPASEPSRDGRTYVGGVATANGRHYVVALYRPHPCRSWLYQFGVNSRGQPTAVTPVPARPTIAGAELIEPALSGNGQELAYSSASSGPGCAVRRPRASHIGILDLATGQMRQWTISGSNSVDSVSLSASGSLLLYTLQLRPSVVRVIPTSAAPGPAADRGRTVIRAATFGRSRWTSFAAIAPDGKTFCFSIYAPGGGGPGKFYVASLATGHPRLVSGGAIFPGLIASDPAVRHLLLYMPRGLAELDLATGKLTYLPGWKGVVAEITW